MDSNMIELPPEIILHVIDCLIPSSPPVAFPPSHPVTRTLINLTLVSSLTSNTAKRLVLKHCLFIDSEQRLTKVLSLKQESPINLTTTSPNGLFLAPFPGTNLNNPIIAQNVSQLLSDISRTLTRLVIDMPLRYLWPEDDIHQVRPVLREAFSRLTHLEEFCSMQDELFLKSVDTYDEPEVWPSWPRLRRLALYNACLDAPDFVEGIKACPNLTHLVLPRPDGLFGHVPSDGPGFGALTRLQRATVVNTERDFVLDFKFNEDDRAPVAETLLGRLRNARLATNSDAPDIESDYICTLVKVAVPLDRADEDEVDISLCQTWVGTHAIDGTLWDTVGTPFLT